MKNLREESQDMLTFEETDSLKGLLIILIVAGHIKQIFSVDTQFLLYSFHITTFLFLPFLFNNDRLSYYNIKKIIRRYYVPYTIFFLVSLLAFTFYLKHELDRVSTLFAWSMGTGKLLHDNIGFSTYWFFPTLVSLLFLIMLFNTLSKNGKRVLILIVTIGHLTIPILSRNTLQYIPMSMHLSIYIFAIGLIVQYLYAYFSWRTYYIRLGTLIVFIVSLVFVYGSQFDLARGLLPNFFHNPYIFILHDIIMISGFFVMIYISDIFKFFRWFGPYTIAIYTVHPFIIQIVDKMYKWTSVTEGFIKLILVIFISYVVSKIIFFININKIVYPR